MALSSQNALQAALRSSFLSMKSSADRFFVEDDVTRCFGFSWLALTGIEVVADANQLFRLIEQFILRRELFSFASMLRGVNGGLPQRSQPFTQNFR